MPTVSDMQATRNVKQYDKVGVAMGIESREFEIYGNLLGEM